jgi:ubiquinone/menaquinone biosynthesis C-methylase UbiE
MPASLRVALNRHLGAHSGAGTVGANSIGVMGLYTDRVLPHLQDRMMRHQPFRPLRERVCAGLRGSIVEIGFGTGLNVRYYPASVERVTAIEPSSVCLRIAQPRIEGAAVPVEFGGLTGEALDLPSGEFDAVLSTWTMCTIPALDAALAEVRRVLKPDGALHFVEHGHAPDPRVARWQARLEPIQKRVAGGCHLTRHISERIEAAGFELATLDTYYVDRTPSVVGFTYEGRAVRR